jgi:hypothetical protein
MGVVVERFTLREIAMMLHLERLVPHGTPEAWLTELLERSGVVVKEISPSRVLKTVR